MSQKKLSFTERVRVIKMIAHEYPMWEKHKFNWENYTLSIFIGPSSHAKDGEEIVIPIQEALKKTKELGYL